MVDRGNVDKHRHKMCGLKVEEKQKWGRNTARERYGPLRQVDMRPPDRSEPQKLGDVNNLRGPGWKGDTPNDFRRGAGEDATKRPGYVPGYRKK
jgi:hypothetical protein